MIEFLRRRWAVFGVLLLLAAFIEWQLVEVPEMQKAFARAEEVWKLPQPVRPLPAKSLEVLAKTRPWGRGQTSGAQAAAGSPAWRIAGIAARGGERILLVRIDKQPVMQLKVGDSLPNGARIAAIGDDFVSIAEGETVRRLEIYSRGKST